MPTTPAPRTLAATAVAGGIAWLTFGVLAITHRDEVRNDVTTTTAAHVAVGAMAVALALTVAGIALLARRIPGSRAPVATGAGQLLLAVASAAVAIKGEDPSWFIAAAPIANALWLFGSIAMAVALRRAGAVPAAVAFGLPAVWLCAIPLSVLGLNVLAGVYWVALGASVLLAPRPVVVPARAV